MALATINYGFEFITSTHSFYKKFSELTSQLYQYVDVTNISADVFHVLLISMMCDNLFTTVSVVMSQPV